METSLVAGWDNFYVITGSSAGGLTGLTFVIIALVADVKGATTAGLRAFVTPTIVHFACVLGLAAFMSMPHQTITTLSVGFGALGLGGLLYVGAIAVNMARQGSRYKAVREDWLWNVIVPTLLYAALVGAAFLVWHRLEPALFGVAIVSLLLLFTGIRNAWDIAVWMTLKRDA
jgi:hypothetical protein